MNKKRKKMTINDLYHGTKKCRRHLLYILDNIYPKYKHPHETPSFADCIQRHKVNKKIDENLIKGLENIQKFIDQYEYNVFHLSINTPNNFCEIEDIDNSNTSDDEHTTSQRIIKTL